MQKMNVQKETIAYLVGGGIASLAAAAFLIRDGAFKGHNIIIFEQSSVLGGSLDAAGTAETGYVMRGGRMIESKYLCTFDLFSSIPTLDSTQTVTEEIFKWNATMKTRSKSRLFRDGRAIDSPTFGLSERHIQTIERLVAEPERLLGRSSIEDNFDPAFFETDFWLMWCTTFAFQPWHSAVELKRYLARFTHMVEGFSQLSGIMRTKFNQFDSLVRPLHRWLEDHGVQFRLGTRVTDLEFVHDSGGRAVQSILFEDGGPSPKQINVAEEDLVIVTLGSMTEGSSVGSTDTAPVLKQSPRGPAWTLWQNIAAHESDFGHPANFSERVDQSQWISFTTTLHDRAFFNHVRDLTGNAPGEGGLITFAESTWLLSIVLPHQPHFIGQPEDVQVLWGYGLHVDTPGNFVKKPMADCTGREIMTEVLGHLGAERAIVQTLESSICIPCMMQLITSQFLCRSEGDRPHVIPPRSKHLAFVGQFCELPDDVVFTVEYSIRSAQTAVYALLGLDRKAPPVYKGAHNPRILFKAFGALHMKSGQTTVPKD